MKLKYISYIYYNDPNIMCIVIGQPSIKVSKNSCNVTYNLCLNRVKKKSKLLLKQKAVTVHLEDKVNLSTLSIICY